MGPVPPSFTERVPRTKLEAPCGPRLRALRRQCLRAQGDRDRAREMVSEEAVKVNCDGELDGDVCNSWPTECPWIKEKITERFFFFNLAPLHERCSACHEPARPAPRLWCGRGVPSLNEILLNHVHIAK